MNLIIDGNAALHIIHGAAINKYRELPGQLYEDTDTGKMLTGLGSDFMDEFFSRYMYSIINLVAKNKLDTVYLVFDTPNSWRFKYIDWYYKQSENHWKQPFIYKEKKDNENEKKRQDEFRAVFNYTNQIIIPKLQKISGLHILKVNGAEGDDIIAGLCEELKGDIVIWSVDSDLIQLLDNKNNNTILITPKRSNTDRKLYLTENLLTPDIKKDEDFINLLDSKIITDNYFLDLVDYLTERCQHKVFKIDPTIDILAKILSGDKQSDNIPSVYTWKSDKGLNMSLTDKKAREIIADLLLKYKKDQLFTLIEDKDSVFLDDIIDNIIKRYNIDPKDSKTRILIKENILLNYRLIKLKRGCIPVPLHDLILNNIRAIKNTTKFDISVYKHVMNVTEYQEFKP